MIGAAYALRTLEAAESSADQVTAAVTECQLKSDPDRDFLNETSRRPPIEARPFTTATRALRALRYYSTKSRTGAVNDWARRVRAWLAACRPVGTEDRLFRISGLKHADASPGELEAAARARWRPIKVTWAGPGIGENPQGACEARTSEL
jgi:hypothetical protein